MNSLLSDRRAFPTEVVRELVCRARDLCGDVRKFLGSLVERSARARALQCECTHDSAVFAPHECGNPELIRVELAIRDRVAKLARALEGCGEFAGVRRECLAAERLVELVFTERGEKHRPFAVRVAGNSRRSHAILRFDPFGPVL